MISDRIITKSWTEILHNYWYYSINIIYTEILDRNIGQKYVQIIRQKYLQKY